MALSSVISEIFDL